MDRVTVVFQNKLQATTTGEAVLVDVVVPYGVSDELAVMYALDLLHGTGVQCIRAFDRTPSLMRV